MLHELSFEAFYVTVQVRTIHLSNQVGSFSCKVVVFFEIGFHFHLSLASTNPRNLFRKLTADSPILVDLGLVDDKGDICLQIGLKEAHKASILDKGPNIVPNISVAMGT